MAMAFEIQDFGVSAGWSSSASAVASCGPSFHIRRDIAPYFSNDCCFARKTSPGPLFLPNCKDAFCLNTFLIRLAMGKVNPTKANAEPLRVRRLDRTGQNCSGFEAARVGRVRSVFSRPSQGERCQEPFQARMKIFSLPSPAPDGRPAISRRRKSRRGCPG